MKHLVALAACLAVAGCATTGAPEVRFVEVKVPVPVSCVPASLGPAPVYFDTDEALRTAPSADNRFALLWAGRGQRIAREAELDAVITVCRAAAQ